MRSITELLSQYQQQHTNRINRITHYFGIPMIVFSILMILNWVSIDIATRYQISFAWLLLIATAIYYFTLHVRLAICATVVFIAMTIIASWIARPAPSATTVALFFALFIGGWILQFLGHLFEKQKPAFFLSKTQLLIGPLFVLVEALKAIGISKYIISLPGGMQMPKE